MNVVVLIEHIKKHITLLSKVIPTHSQVPVLLHVLIEATAEGLFISATDLEMAVRVKIPAKITQEGAITVSGKHFVEVMNSLSAKKAQLSLTDEGMLISSDDGKIVLQTIPKDEFPSLYEKKGAKLYTFSSNEVIEIFSKLVFAVSLEDSRPELTGVYMVQKDNGIDFVATDGYRMSLKHLEAKKMLPTSTGMIVSAKLISEVMQLKDQTIDLYVYEEGNQVIFETEDCVLIGRLIGGTFPDYARVIPQSHRTTVTVDREDFLKSMRLSSIFARESANIARIKVADKQLTVFSRSSGVGEGEIHLAVAQEGEENEIAFNVKFLTDVLRNIDDSQVHMELNSATEPAVFKTSSDSGFLHVIMPVKVQE